MEYKKNGCTYRLSELRKTKLSSHEFILMHNLFRSDKTGKIINLSLLKLYFSSRWYCDILRAMDYFHFAKVKCDVRIDDAISAINDKRNEDGMKKLAAHQPRQTHFEMEKQDNPDDGIH